MSAGNGNSTPLSGVRALLASLLLTAIAFFVRFALTPLLGETMPVMTFIPAIMASTWFGGFNAGILSTTAGALLALLYFVPPYSSLIPETTEASVGMLLYFVTGLLCTFFVDGYRHHRQRVRISDRNASLSRARLAELLESIDDGFVALDQDWRFTWVNPKATELSGRDGGTLTSGLFWQAFPAFAETGAAAIFRRAMTERVAGRAEVFEATSNRWLEARIFPASEGGLTVYLTDISERRRADAELRRARKQTEDILGSIQESFIVLDREWRFVWVNQRVSDKLGKSLADIVGRHVFEVSPEARGTACETFCAKVYAEGTPQHFEVCYPGASRWYEVHAYPTEEGGLSAYILDITDRQNAEAKLRIREAELSAIMDNVPVLVSYYGTDGICRSSNRRYREFFGEGEMHEGRGIVELTPDDHFTRAVSGQVVSYSTQVCGRDAQMRDLQTTLTPLRNETGAVNGVIALSVDVTERNRAEITLRASEERHRFLAESIPQCVWTRGHDGRINYVNPHWTEYTGLTLEESRMDGWLDLVHPDDEAPLREAMAQRLEGKPYEVEFRFRRASDGALRWHLARGRYLNDQSGEAQWMGIAVDIHGRKESEDAIRESERRYSTLVSAVPALVWSADADGNNTWVSEQWTTYTGQASKDGVGVDWAKPIHPEDADRWAAAWADSVRTGQPFELEYRIVNCTGEARWFLCRTLPVKNGDGRMQWLGTCTDIDDRRRAEEALRHTNATLTAFIRACPLAVTVLDEDGTIRLWNPAAEALYGWPEAEAIGRYHPAIPPAMRGAFQENVRRVLAGQPLLGAETVRLRRDGTTFMGQSWTAAVGGGDGSRQLISIVADVTERIRAEAAIRETEQRFRTMADQAPVLVWVADTSGMFTWVNRPWLEFTGRMPLEEYGRAWLEGVHPDDAGVWDDCRSEAWEKRTAFSFEFRLRRHDGEFRWILVRAVPLVASDGTFNGYIGSCIDLTERRQAENALRESEERLRLALSAADMATWDWDLGTGDVTWSKNLADLSGLGGNPPDFDSAMGTVHPDDLPRVLAAVEGSVTQGLPYECEYRAVHPDGRIEWILGKGHVVRDESGDVKRLIGVALDVTARREADQALRESEERLRMAKEAAELGIWEWDIKTGQVKWSQEIYRFIGVEPGPEFLTLDFWKDCVHASDREMAIAAGLRAVETGQLLSIEFRVVRRDGAVRWLLSRGRPVMDESGERTRMIGVNIDVTERRETEEKLRQTNAELEQYAFAASHDLQEPLRIVMLYSQLLTRRVGDQFDAETRRHFENIRLAASRMQMLIDDLLSYSRILAEGERAFAPVSMDAVLEVASQACKAAVDEADGVIEAEELPVVHGDYNALVGVLQNLISNAVKYRVKDVAPRVEVRAEREADWWHFRVSDNGIGINPAYHTRIFGVFKRLHGKEVPGTGIGLAICKRTVEQHGGKIWVEGKEGEGSTFHFTLPAVPVSAEAADSAQV
ncbi:MAG: PAS domain S-box protein [Bryobacteraceae bacterium]|nr:PAS domain S-box protein [Bryobacteraceae bacterium]